MLPHLRAYAGKRVFVTGHTGFKGSWLCEWLIALGADVRGYSLAPSTRPALFQQLRLSGRMGHGIGDVRDEEALFKAIRAARPDYLFHLAAQPIVRSAHARPAETWSTNVMGTVNVLEALRRLGRPCPGVIVTTDKVYAEASRPRAEDDPLSGDEPYGASKAAAELAVRAWRRSFGLRAVATARSGNVIGGGDWAKDRLVPDCVRALSAGRTIPVRNPAFVRPWQHVLDPLHGYLLLGVWLGTRKRADPEAVPRAFNFGPPSGGHRTVRDLVEEVLGHWPGRWRAARQVGTPREAPVLRLDASEARRLLGWMPRWGFAESIARTVAWYQHARSPRAAREITQRQIADFSRESE
jgi:CDP-glucose 4,6-dehydratase